MTRTLALTGILMMAAVLVVPSAFARGRGHGGGGEGRGDRDFSCRGVEKLDLSDEQAATIDALKEAYRDAADPMRDDLRVQRDELRALWEADSPDRDAILAKMEQMDAQDSALRVMKVDFKLDIREVLTPEQRAELEEFRAERSERRSERRGQRGEMRGERGERGERGDCDDCDRRGRGRGGWDD